MEAMPVPEQYRWPKETLADGSPPAALANLYQEFAHALNGSGSIDLDFRYALRMHRLLDVLEESSRTGVRQMVA
jgi:predicted dehydrogenase